MSTPINQRAEKEKKPAPSQRQAAPKGQAAASKSAPAAPKPQPQRPARSSGKTAQTPARIASQPPPKSEPAAAKASAPPVPKPRDPSLARRDERREARRLEIRARQQERRTELRQAKRQTLLIRYDLIIAPILLIGLVSLFLVLGQPIDALIAGLLIVFGAFTVLAYATFIPATRASRLAHPRQPALGEAEVVDSTLSEDAQPPEAPSGEGAESKPAQ